MKTSEFPSVACNTAHKINDSLDFFLLQNPRHKSNKPLSGIHWPATKDYST